MGEFSQRIDIHAGSVQQLSSACIKSSDSLLCFTETLTNMDTTLPAVKPSPFYVRSLSILGKHSPNVDQRKVRKGELLIIIISWVLVRHY